MVDGTCKQDMDYPRKNGSRSMLVPPIVGSEYIEK